MVAPNSHQCYPFALDQLESLVSSNSFFIENVSNMTSRVNWSSYLGNHSQNNYFKNKIQAHGWRNCIFYITAKGLLLKAIPFNKVLKIYKNIEISIQSTSKLLSNALYGWQQRNLRLMWAEFVLILVIQAGDDKGI